VGDIASFMGLKVPANVWQFPAEFINEMREMNSGQQVRLATTSVEDRLEQR
jgi:hypothetical protein